jgi:hypothetical protein
VMAAKNEGDAWGTSPGDARGTSSVGIFVAYGIAFLVGAEGGSGGGRAVMHATNGGGTAKVGPRHRHSMLVTLVSVLRLSVVRLLRDS